MRIEDAYGKTEMESRNDGEDKRRIQKERERKTKIQKVNLSHELREETEELSDGESNPGLPRFVT